MDAEQKAREVVAKWWVTPGTASDGDDRALYDRHRLALGHDRLEAAIAAAIREATVDALEELAAEMDADPDVPGYASMLAWRAARAAKETP